MMKHSKILPSIQVLQNLTAKHSVTIDNEVLFNKDNSLTPQQQPPTALLYASKKALNYGTEILNQAFAKGAGVEELIQKRTWLIDQLLIYCWQATVCCEDLSLVAVGGYGRRELHLASDIDLMILTNPRIAKEVVQQIQTFLNLLWDSGLEVGHSVRTVRDCVADARSDITIVTNIMESRLLTGQAALFESMRQLISPQKIWPAKKFFKAKYEEQIQRHQRYADTEYNLEPNIKECPGGLRDIQVIAWLAQRYFGTNDIHDLIKHDFLTADEYQTLHTNKIFLWRLRYALHLLAKRRDDRLLFSCQKHIAASFGFHAKDNSGVEKFMKMYYQIVRELSCLNEILLQHFQETLILDRGREKISPLNKRFQIHNGLIELCHNQVFKRYPFALLEIFLLKQLTPSIKGVRASTIRAIRQHVDMIDDDFRNDIRNKSLFMEIIRQPRYVGHELRRMHRYGILSQYLPAFGNIEGRMQFDLFHTYTVDEHTLLVIQNMRLFGLPEYAETYPLCQRILQTLPKRELLYIAGLFHDIAKGRKGDHAKLGALDAIDFCLQHGLSAYDAGITGWLVEKHLILSKTAQREDINDPEVINKFSTTVGDCEHLNYLYLLTVADINATNPLLWTDWKDSLFQQLYYETTRALRRGLENPLDKKERIKESKNLVLQLLGKRIQAKFNIDQFWRALITDYFIRYSPDEIAWHIKSIAGNNHFPLVKVRQQTARGGTEIFVYMHNQDNIFATTTQTLEQLSLTVVDARIITSTDGLTLDTYIILDEAGNPIKDKKQQSEIVGKLHDNLANIKKFNRRAVRHRSLKQKNFLIPTTVQFTQDQLNQRTVMEVSSTDHIGMLSGIGMALTKYDIHLHNAKIATYGSRAEDIFFITDDQDKPVSDSARLIALENLIIKILT